jgi:hypothetical protein
LSTTAEDNRWAVLGFSLAQRDVTNLDFVLRPGLRIAGRVEAYGGSPIVVRDMHVAIDAADGTALDVEPAAVTPANRFTIDRLPAGQYFVRAGRVPRGWMIRSITHEGRDITDAPLALSADAEIVVTLTNRVTEVHGTVRTAAGAPDPDAAVVVFPADRDDWRAAGSLLTRSVRPDRNGEFSIVGLPPGEYRCAAVPAEELDDGDPAMFDALAAHAKTVRIDEGEKMEVPLQTRARARR